jgi:AcrR family transcriptional regulator
MFAERGYGATSLRDIAARLGLSAGAVYPHYKSKEALLYAISLEGHAAALSIVRAASEAAEADVDSRGPSATARLRRTVAAYAEWHATNHALARVVQYELRSLSPAHHRRIASLRRQTSATFTSIIERGLETGEFVVHDVDATVLAISSLCIDISRWFPSRRHRDGSALGQSYADLVMRMVVAPAPTDA